MLELGIYHQCFIGKRQNVPNVKYKSKTAVICRQYSIVRQVLFTYISVISSRYVFKSVTSRRSVVRG